MSTGFLTKSKAPSFSARKFRYFVLDPFDEGGPVAIRQSQVREAQREVAGSLQLAARGGEVVHGA